MLFNSVTFLLFFVLFFNLYWWINNKGFVRWRNFFTLSSSYIFYGWWDWRFLGLIFISSLADFLIGRKLQETSNRKFRRLLLLASLSVNIGILGFFKYFNFFIDSFNTLLAGFAPSLNTSNLNIILPVGISFYTFQTLSYTIDIYKGKLTATKDALSFFVFVAFFPQLVAGPIERASNLLKQFKEKQVFGYPMVVDGLRLVLWGLFKKIVIADNFGILADQLFANSNQASGATTWVASIFFAFQIYADFSGYSDIAIGISKMLGIKLMKNFASPYFSTSFSEFWKRWHISLSSWFRDYVYIPLGGKRKKEFRVLINVLITFLLSGLWHGAKITFVIWGALHGIALIIEKKSNIKIPKVLALPLVFLITTLLWIPFRAENTNHLLALSHSLADLSSYSFELVRIAITDFSINKFFFFCLVFILFLILEYKMQLLDFSEWIRKKSGFFRISIYYVLLISILLLGNFNSKPYFIYFQF